MSAEYTDQQPVAASSRFLARRQKWGILGVVLLLVLGGAFLLWRVRQSGQPPTTTNLNRRTQNNSAATNSSSAAQQVTIPLATDIDKDGLPDPREAELKTDPKLPDTDGDQLSDYDEVQVYATNPLKQDTDSDGYPDGEEVHSGNNPKGSGKLFDLTQTLGNINAQ